MTMSSARPASPPSTTSTTAVYLPKDSMALTLNGTTRWPSAKELQQLGETRASSTPRRIRDILGRISEAIDSTANELRAYIKEHQDFAEIGNRMLEIWEEGTAHSLIG
jgi:serine/threonine-protein kinase HipA